MAEGAAVGHGGLAIDDLTNDGVAGQAEEQVLSGPLHGGELSETRLKGGLVDAGRMELLIEPAVEADGFDGFEIAGTRAEGEAVEGVEETIVTA